MKLHAYALLPGWQTVTLPQLRLRLGREQVLGDPIAKQLMKDSLNEHLPACSTLLGLAYPEEEKSSQELTNTIQKIEYAACFELNTTLKSLYRLTDAQDPGPLFSLMEWRYGMEVIHLMMYKLLDATTNQATEQLIWIAPPVRDGGYQRELENAQAENR